jgi:hypothetical protein
MSERNLRDYGRGDPGPVVGAPKVVDGPMAAPCPHCGCEGVVLLKVTLETPHPNLRMPEGTVPVGVYSGCPACPWASPMMMTAEEPS